MSKPKVVGVRIDIETRSDIPIKSSAYRYCDTEAFAVLIVSYCPIYQYPGGARKLGRIRRLDLENPDPNFARVIQDPKFEKHAYNANFERVALSRWLGMPVGTYLDPENWRCSAVRANVNGVFGSLDEVARAVRSPIKKDPEGRRLIKLFSVPDKAGKFHDVSGNCWCGVDHSEDFDKFGDYCDNDVLTEAVVARSFPDPPEFVQREYEMDQRINDRGVRHFSGLSKQAVEQVRAERDRLMDELKELTGLENPNSVKQFREWLEQEGYPMLSLDKEHRAEALEDPTIPEHVAEALTLKGAASLSSVQKHQAALDSRCSDGRIRGSLQFYGAHTGREAGRGIQPQNLPRYEAPAADRKRLLLGIAGEDAPTIAKGTVRASLVPARGHVFVTVDYNAIEARVLAGLAGEQWAKAEFAGAGKIYEATAERMFGIPAANIIADRAACGECGYCPACVTRSKGKVSNLALGYAGGAGALITMGAESAGIDCGNYKELHAEWVESGKPGKFFQWNRDAHDYPELLRLRDLYRDSSPATVGFWKQCATAWDVCALTGKPAAFGDGGIVKMLRDGKHNRMVLPSGRSIWYRFAMSHPDPDRDDRIDRRTFIGKGTGVGHIRTETHGGKLTENVTQAVARDVLFDLLMKIQDRWRRGWPGRPVLHVHDEVVLEVPDKHADKVLDETLEMMSETPEWGDFLILKGEGSIMERYGK